MSQPLDYSRTAQRHGWDLVPAAAVRELESALGSRVVDAGAPVGSGFGGQYAGPVHLADGRRVFVKAAPPWLEYQATCLVMEAQHTVLLPPDVPHAAPLALVSAARWELLALEHVDGVMPGFPWTVAHLDAVQDSCLALTRVTDLDGYTDREWAAYFHRDDVHGEDIRAIREGTYHRPEQHGVDAWLDAAVTAHGREIADLADASRDLRGKALLHNDIRPDNLLVDVDARAHLLDWNWLCRGPEWVDFVGLLPMAHRQGLDVDPWLAGPLFDGAGRDEVDAVIAAVAVKMLGGQSVPLPPGLPTSVWQHKLVHAHDAVRLLTARRGWA